MSRRVGSAGRGSARANEAQQNPLDDLP